MREFCPSSSPQPQLGVIFQPKIEKWKEEAQLSLGPSEQRERESMEGERFWSGFVFLITVAKDFWDLD